MTDTNHIAQKSREYFSSGLCCAESVLLAIAESQGIEFGMDTAHRNGFLQRVSAHVGPVRGGDRRRDGDQSRDGPRQAGRSR